MSVNLSAIRDLLLPGVRKVTGEYKQKWIPCMLEWLSAHQEKKKEMLPKARKILEKAHEEG